MVTTNVNTTAVKTALLSIVAADPEAVIIIGAYAPVAETITLARRDIDPVFMTTSFVGSKRSGGRNSDPTPPACTSLKWCLCRKTTAYR